VVPERVVPLAKLRGGQHLVGLGDLLEPLLRFRVLVDVRVVGAGDLAVCALDVVRGGAGSHPEHLVEVTTYDGCAGWAAR
jgi:hypothetical protein